MFLLCQGDITRKVQVRKMKIPELIEWTYLILEHEKREKEFWARVNGAEIKEQGGYRKDTKDDLRPLAEIFAERLPKGASVGIGKIYVSKEELERRKKEMN